MRLSVADGATDTVKPGHVFVVHGDVRQIMADAVLYPDYAEGSIRRFSTLESGESWKDAVAAEEEGEDGDGTGGADFVPISARQE